MVSHWIFVCSRGVSAIVCVPNDLLSAEEILHSWLSAAAIESGPCPGLCHIIKVNFF